MVFVSAGVVIGALIGIPALAFGKLELGLSLSVGGLLGGLLWGWFHSMRPMIGRIPTPTLWILEFVGLTGFVAAVGLAAGLDFVKGQQISWCLPDHHRHCHGYHPAPRWHPGGSSAVQDILGGSARRMCWRRDPQHRRLLPSRKPPRALSQRSATAWPTLSGTSAWRCGELS